MNILVDMDSIIADFYHGVLDAYEARHGVRPPVDQLDTWDAKMPNGESCYEYFKHPGFFEGLKPIEGGLRFIRKAMARGHNVYIVSSATLEHAPAEKFRWLSKHLPEFPRRNVVFTASKFLVKGHVLIDDHAHNAEEYRSAHPTATIIGIRYPYNKDCPSFDFLASSYLDFERAWEEIDAYTLEKE